MTEKTCDWKHTPNITRYTHPRAGVQPGFADEWTVSCIPEGTIRTEPRRHWIHCPYCGKKINWLTNPDDPSLPQTVGRLV